MWRDLHFGFRQLTRNKLVTAAIILMLAIAIGANTAIFSFINALLLKPLPVRDPQSLFLLEQNREKQVIPETGFLYSIFADVSARKDLFTAAVAEQKFDNTSFVPLDQNGSVRMISEQIVSPNYFTELGVRAILGRVLTSSDSTATGTIPAVISYQFWQSQFNQRKDILGHTIRLKNHPFLIVGVLPKNFHSIDIDRAPDVRLPISASPALFGYTVWNPHLSAPPLEVQRSRPPCSPYLRYCGSGSYHAATPCDRGSKMARYLCLASGHVVGRRCARNKVLM